MVRKKDGNLQNILQGKLKTSPLSKQNLDKLFQYFPLLLLCHLHCDTRKTDTLQEQITLQGKAEFP